MTIIRVCWEILIQLSPWMLIGMFLSGLMHVLLPRDFVRRRFRGTSGVVNAVLLGVPLPLCSCGVVPAGIGLKNDGASDGASVGFLISTPQTGVDSILVSAGFLGWPFAIFKMVSAAVIGIAGGLMTDATASESSSELPVEQPSSKNKDTNLKGKIVDAWQHGVEIVRSVWLWLLIGVVISAVIQVLLPESWFQRLNDFGLLPAMLMVLLLSVPLYVCATASVPIAAALVASGMSPAVAIVFLIAGPATNVTTIAAVYGRFGARTLAVYLISIIVGSMIFASAFHWIIDPTVVVEHAGHDHHPGGWLASASAAALLLLIATFIYDDARRLLSGRGTGEPDLQISVTGMHCNGCVSKVETALKKVDGVESVNVQLDPGIVSIVGIVERELISDAVTSLGFLISEGDASKNVSTEHSTQN